MGVVKLRWGGRCSLYSSNTHSIVFTPLTPLYTVPPQTPFTYTLTPSHPHRFTPSHPHPLTPSHPSHPHPLTPSPLHPFTPSHPHTITPSHLHTLTPSHPHSKKQEDARQLRHISQLKKETRKKENKIQSLEADAQRKAIVMKRRADEVIITSSNNYAYVYSSSCQFCVCFCF